MEKRKDTVENAQIEWDTFTSPEIERQLGLIFTVLDNRQKETLAALKRLSRLGIGGEPEPAEQAARAAGRPRLSEEEKERKRAEKEAAKLARRASSNGNYEELSEEDIREEE